MFISKYQGPQHLLKYMDNLLYPIDNYLFLSIDYKLVLLKVTFYKGGYKNTVIDSILDW